MEAYDSGLRDGVLGLRPVGSPAAVLAFKLPSCSGSRPAGVGPVGSPAAVLAFKGRYTTHEWIYAVTVVVVMILATTGMHFKGIQDEKDFDGAG